MMCFWEECLRGFWERMVFLECFVFVASNRNVCVSECFGDKWVTDWWWWNEIERPNNDVKCKWLSDWLIKIWELKGNDGKNVCEWWLPMLWFLDYSSYTHRHLFFCFTNSQVTLYYIQDKRLFGNGEHELSDRCHTPKTYRFYLSIFLRRLWLGLLLQLIVLEAVYTSCLRFSIQSLFDQSGDTLSAFISNIWHASCTRTSTILLGGWISIPSSLHKTILKSTT